MIGSNRRNAAWLFAIAMSALGSPFTGHVSYASEATGTTGETAASELSGTRGGAVGKSRSIEALRFRLSDPLTRTYSACIGGHVSHGVNRLIGCAPQVRPPSPRCSGSFPSKGRVASSGKDTAVIYYTQFYGDYLFHSILMQPRRIPSSTWTLGVESLAWLREAFA